MGDVIKFAPPEPRLRASERRVLRMIEQARAQYQAIFPDEKPTEDTAPSEMNPESLA